MGIDYTFTNVANRGEDRISNYVSRLSGKRVRAFAIPEMDLSGYNAMAFSIGSDLNFDVTWMVNSVVRFMCEEYKPRIGQEKFDLIYKKVGEGICKCKCSVLLYDVEYFRIVWLWHEAGHFKCDINLEAYVNRVGTVAAYKDNNLDYNWHLFLEIGASRWALYEIIRRGYKRLEEEFVMMLKEHAQYNTGMYQVMGDQVLAEYESGQLYAKLVEEQGIDEKKINKKVVVKKNILHDPLTNVKISGRLL